MKRILFADFSLLLVALIWGAAFVIVQNAVELLDPFTFNAIRFLFATLFLFGWIVIVSRHLLQQITKKLLLSGFIMGTWLCVAFALQTFALIYTTSSKTGFLTGLNVVLVPIFAYFFLRQYPKPSALFGTILALIGLYLLTFGDSTELNRGDLLAFLCAIAFAMHIIVTSKFTHLYPSLLLTTTQLAVVTLWSIICAILFEPWYAIFRSEIYYNEALWYSLFITAIFATAIAFLVQTYAQRLTSPAHVALIITMEPVFAAITGYLWAGDRLTTTALLGCFLIFSGMLFAELPLAFLSKLKWKKTHA
ncbi:DMT family transporter [Bacillus solimangrovi]|uniref:EamA domain-containing protein n=1 Tax=Bacillus solimangrovi TaxID=1305675 RepID=A0A1E5LFJ7_9BACI|nr:DMT family transporter [Bacillus solimangrovi]OEH92851.1 hypothetical protein BFG57_02325 [Bacillus solimangrovi]